MKHVSALGLALALALSTPSAAQDLCEGNGYGGAYFQVGPAYLGGGYFSHDLGSPNAPGSFVVLAYSDGFQQSFHPLVGSVCLNLFSPAFGLIVLPTDGAGNVHFDLALPAIPTLVTLPPFYANALTFEGGQWSISKTVPRWLESPNSWTPVAPMGTPRMYHTATNLGVDGKSDRIKVFVAGGGGGTVTLPTATDATEIFDPLSRTFTAGPTMAVERATHTATLLPDGRVLLAGGLDSLGVCTRTCELYDRTTNSLTATGDMTTGRAGHTATLLDDGRVLVAGGFADYQNPTFFWEAALDSAQDSAELYDPATGVWTPVSQPMASRRAGHSATKLADGTVMVVNGINGGGISTFGSTSIVPSFTATVELFHPTTATFTPLPDLNVPVPPFLFPAGGRAFHGASLLGTGEVLVTGGVFRGGSSGEAISTAHCALWNGSAWVDGAPLTNATAWHNQITLKNGKAFVGGGLQATGFILVAMQATGIHLGAAFAPSSDVGLNPGLPGSAPDARGVMSMTRLHDGSLLFLGGSTGTSASSLATGYVYTPAP